MGDIPPTKDAPESGALRLATGIVEDGAKDRQFVTALARGFEVLRAFQAGEALLGNQEIAARTGLPKPTISRLTHTLTRLGYLEAVPGLGKYRLGVGVLALAGAFRAGVALTRLAKPLMQDLADATDTSVALGSRDHDDCLYIEHCRSKAPISLALDLGSRVPLMTSAMGRAILALMPTPDLDAYLVRDRVLHPHDAAVRERDLRQAIAGYHRDGFTLSAGDWRSDVTAVGVPILPPDGSPPLALNCGGPSFRVSPDFAQSELGPRLVDLAATVRQRLGEA